MCVCEAGLVRRERVRQRRHTGLRDSPRPQLPARTSGAKALHEPVGWNAAPACHTFPRVPRPARNRPSECSRSDGQRWRNSKGEGVQECRSTPSASLPRVIAQNGVIAARRTSRTACGTLESPHTRCSSCCTGATTRSACWGGRGGMRERRRLVPLRDLADRRR